MRSDDPGHVLIQKITHPPWPDSILRESEFPGNRERYREFDAFSAVKLKNFAEKANGKGISSFFAMEINRTRSVDNRARISEIRE
jgi:hypothetical protein